MSSTTVTDECNLQPPSKAVLSRLPLYSQVELITHPLSLIVDEIELLDRMGKGPELYEYVLTSRPSLGPNLKQVKAIFRDGRERH